MFRPPRMQPSVALPCSYSRRIAPAPRLAASRVFVPTTSSYFPLVSPPTLPAAGRQVPRPQNAPALLRPGRGSEASAECSPDPAPLPTPSRVMEFRRKFLPPLLLVLRDPAHWNRPGAEKSCPPGPERPLCLATTGDSWGPLA